MSSSSRLMLLKLSGILKGPGSCGLLLLMGCICSVVPLLKQLLVEQISVLKGGVEAAGFRRPS